MKNRKSDSDMNLHDVHCHIMYGVDDGAQGVPERGVSLVSLPFLKPA